MNCSNCGKLNGVNDKFCDGCGTQLVNNLNQNLNNVNSNLNNNIDQNTNVNMVSNQQVNSNQNINNINQNVDSVNANNPNMNLNQSLNLVNSNLNNNINQDSNINTVSDQQVNSNPNANNINQNVDSVNANNLNMNLNQSLNPINSNLNNNINQNTNINVVNNQQINSNPNVNNINKKPKKKRGCLITFIILILIILGIVLLVNFLVKDKEKEEIAEFSKDYEFLAYTNDGEYIINGAPTDIAFYVTGNTSYIVTDEDGNNIETTLNNYKITNPNGYEKGKTYTIKLKNGSFTSDQLQGVNEVTFKIKRDEVKHYKFKENVKNINKNTLSIIDSDTFKTQTEYSIGDVIVIESNDIISEAYIITSKNNDEYDYRPAELNEIYSELNYYTEGPVDLSNYTVAAEIEKYVLENVEQSSCYNAIVETVSAAPKVDIKLKEVTNGIKVTVKVVVPAGDKSIFGKTTNHSLEFTFTQTLQATQTIDITLTNWDVSLNITSGQDFEVKFKNQYLDYGKLANKAANSELLQKIKSALKNTEFKDVDTKKGKVATVLIPTGVPCLNVKFELSIMNKFSISADFSLKESQTTNIVVGFDYGLNEKFKPIGSYKKDYDGVTISFAGKMEDRLGLELSVGLDVLNTVTVSADVAAGIYAEASLSVESTNLTTFETSAKAGAGIFLEFGISAKAGNFKYKHVFVDQKWPIVEKKWSYVYPEEENETNNNGILQGNGNNTSQDSGSTGNNSSKDDLSYAKVKNRLEHNSCVSSLTDNSYDQYKFNYKNGKFVNSEIVLTYYVDFEYEWLNNLFRLLAKIISIYYTISTQNIAYFTEDGNYLYITLYADKEATANEIGYTGEDFDYNTIKSHMISQGYSCN